MSELSFKSDPTEDIRRAQVAELNGSVQEDTVEQAREKLAAQYGQLWNTEQLQQDFSVTGFMAPYVTVRRKRDGATGTLQFTHNPRFYFRWQPDVPEELKDVIDELPDTTIRAYAIGPKDG